MTESAHKRKYCLVIKQQMLKQNETVETVTSALTECCQKLLYCKFYNHNNNNNNNNNTASNDIKRSMCRCENTENQLICGSARLCGAWRLKFQLTDYLLFESTVAALVETFSASAGMKCVETHYRLSVQDRTVTDPVGWSTQRSIKQQDSEDWSKTNQTRVNIDFTFFLSLFLLIFIVCNIYYNKITWKPQQKICICHCCDLTVQLECHENTKNMNMSEELSSRALADTVQCDVCGMWTSSCRRWSDLLCSNLKEP